MGGSLKSRLARLKSLDRAGSEPAAEGELGGGAREGLAEEGRPPAFLSGWERLATFVYERELLVADPLPEEIDPAPFLPRSAWRLPSARRKLGDREGPGPEPVGSERLRFFDLETTGLSGGSGTIAFLAALGRRSAQGLSIRQLFLADYPGEADFIAALLAELGEGTVLVSYNGRSFDYPLLRTRCVMNGLAAPEPPHLDVLYPARRLWRRASGGASLGLLEELVLGKDRGPDVPGSRIPALYLDFLRRGEEAEMGLVMSHNASDVASLASLLSIVAATYERPLEAAADSLVDAAALGLSLLAMGREGEGEALLEEAAASGSEEAFILLSRRYRGQCRDGDFERLWKRRPEGWAAAVEGAKYFEHSRRDCAAALVAVEAAGRWAKSDWEREALAWRRARLERKLIKKV